MTSPYIPVGQPLYISSRQPPAGGLNLEVPFREPKSSVQPDSSLNKYVEVSSSVVDSRAINKDAVEKVVALSSIEDDWNSYGATAPNSDAIGNAAHALFILAGFGLTPTHVSPSSEGGVTLSFTKHDKFAAIEFYNTGEGAAVISKPDSETQAWDFEPSTSDYPELARHIQRHFHS
jgi:hypothetical protein